MPANASPFGLKIVKTQGGPLTRAPERLILSVNSSGQLVLPTSGTQGSAITVGNIYAGDPVWYPGTGAIQSSLADTAGTVTYNTQSLTSIVGTFQGVEYSDSSGKRTVANKWTSPGVFPGSEVWFWYTAATTADTIFEIQTNSSITQAAVGNTYGVIGVGTPNAVTGFSTVALSTSGAAGATGSLVISGLAYDPVLGTSQPNNGYAAGTPTAGNNNWGDNYVNVYVKLASGQFTTNVASF